MTHKNMNLDADTAVTDVKRQNKRNLTQRLTLYSKQDKGKLARVSRWTKPASQLQKHRALLE